MNKRPYAFLIIIMLFASAVFSQTTDHTPVPYSKETTPQWLLDFRDTEIITLGAMPFVTIAVSLTYSLFNVAMHGGDGAYFINPFAKDGFTSIDEQVGIIVTSSLICVGIGLTNLTINLIKRNNLKKKNSHALQPNINITTIENELNFAPIPPKYKREKEYLFGNIENAVF